MVPIQWFGEVLLVSWHCALIASLRPATASPSKQTNGRKSTKRVRAKAAKEAANDRAKGDMNDDSLPSSSSANEDEEVYVDTTGP